MKKIILILSIISFYTTAFSQTFLILNALKQDASNTGYTITGNLDNIIKAQFYIVNNSATDAPFKVKKIEDNILTGTVNTFCFNEQCYPPYVMQTPSSILLAAGDTTLSSSFYAEYTPGGVAGSSTITYVVFNANNPNDSTYVNITYNAELASVPRNDFTRVEFSNPYPNPANSQTKINYNIPVSYVRATITLRNLIGTTVKEIELPNPQGKLVIDLSDLNEGIYFYSLIIDGNVILTRKLIKN